MLGVVLGAALGAPILGAAPTADVVTLTWSGPAECPGPAWGRERVESFLGGALATASSRGPLAIDVALRAARGGYAVQITFAEDASVRSFADGDCEVLADASAFVVASNIDPEAIEPELEPEPEPEPEPKTEPEPEPDPDPEPEPKTEPQLKIQVAGTFLGELRPLLVPGVGPSVGGQVALLLGRGRIALGGFWAPGARYQVPDTPTSLRVGASGGSLRGCYAAVARPRVELPVCAGVEIAALGAQGILGVSGSASSWQLWLAGLVGAGVTWRATPVLGVSGGVDLSVAARRPSFVVDGQGTAYTPYPVAITPWIGLELRSK